MSSGDSTTIKWLAEVTPGVTPADDAGWAYVPYLSETLSGEPQYAESGLISTHSQTEDLLPTTSTAGGNIVTELRKGEYDDIFAGFFRQTDWTADVLKFGQVRRTYSIERHFSDLGTYFAVNTGMQPNTMSVNITRGQPAIVVTMGFEGLGATASTTTSAVGAGSTSAIGSLGSFQCGAGITVFEIGGVQTTAIARSLVINMTHNLQPIEGIGSDVRDDMAFGAIQVTGNADFYLGTAAFTEYVNKLAGTERDLKVRTALSGGLFYEFFVPRLKWGTGSPNSSGRSTQVMQNMAFSGLYDGTELTSLSLTRDGI